MVNFCNSLLRSLPLTTISCCSVQIEPQIQFLESVLNFNLKMKVVLAIFILFSVFAINSGTPSGTPIGRQVGGIIGGIGLGNHNRPGWGRFRRDTTKTVLNKRYPNEGFSKHYPNGYHAIAKRSPTIPGFNIRGFGPWLRGFRNTGFGFRGLGIPRGFGGSRGFGRRGHSSWGPPLITV